MLNDVIKIATTYPQVDIKPCKIIQGMISDLSTSYYGEIRLVRIYNHGTITVSIINDTCSGVSNTITMQTL